MNILEQLEQVSESISDKLFHRYRHHYKTLELSKRNLRVELANSQSTDSSGNASIPVFGNQSGRPFVLGRILVLADGYTPKAPFTGAGYMAVNSGPGKNAGTIKDFAPYTAGGAWLPNVSDYSGINGLRFEKNETVYLDIFTGPTSTNITVRIFGFLEPNDTDYEI